MEASLALLEL
jgi:hypothetical protein